MIEKHSELGVLGVSEVNNLSAVREIFAVTVCLANEEPFGHCTAEAQRARSRKFLARKHSELGVLGVSAVNTSFEAEHLCKKINAFRNTIKRDD